jgi:hypothetical protein
MNKKGGIISLAIIAIVIIGAYIVFIPKDSTSISDGSDPQLSPPGNLEAKIISGDVLPWRCIMYPWLDRCQRHLECINNQCKSVAGGGDNDCSKKNNACFKDCVGTECLVITLNTTNSSNVTDLCTNSSQCQQPMHLECQNYQCALVAGGGSDDCSPQGSACGCTETDSGFDPLNYGCNTFFNESSGQVETNCDHCWIGSQIAENVCIGGGVSSNITDCQTLFGTGYTCVSGVCVPPVTNQTYLACENQLCVIKNGTNPDECSYQGASCNITNTTLPDLIINSMWLTVTNNTGNVSGNYTATMSITVKNNGTGSAGSSTLNISLLGPSGILQFAHQDPTPSLGPGQFDTWIDVDVPIFGGSGFYYLNTDTDTFDVVTESNENNNWKQLSFYGG